jgi:hypothetical protein
MSKPLIVHPAVLARAKRECNNYLLTRTGLVGNTATFTIARLRKGQTDPQRTYEMHAELETIDGIGPTFVPVRCTCEDATCRGRICKHCTIFALWADIPVTKGLAADDK